MSIRDTILQNVRNNQPSSRELPAIPKFHSGQPVDLKNKFAAALKELSGEVVTEPPADFEKFLRDRFPDAKVICSTVPEYAGNKEPEDFARWSDASSIDVTIVRSPLGCRRNRFGPVFGRRVPRQHYWCLRARHRDTARSRGNCREHSRRLQSSPFPEQSIQLADVRTFRLSRYRGNHRPPDPGSNNSYSNILADGSSHEGLGGNSEQLDHDSGQSNHC